MVMFVSHHLLLCEENVLANHMQYFLNYVY